MEADATYKRRSAKVGALAGAAESSSSASHPRTAIVAPRPSAQAETATSPALVARGRRSPPAAKCSEHVIVGGFRREAAAPQVGVAEAPTFALPEHLRLKFEASASSGAVSCASLAAPQDTVEGDLVATPPTCRPPPPPPAAPAAPLNERCGPPLPLAGAAAIEVGVAEVGVAWAASELKAVAGCCCCELRASRRRIDLLSDVTRKF